MNRPVPSSFLWTCLGLMAILLAAMIVVAMVGCSDGIDDQEEYDRIDARLRATSTMHDDAAARAQTDAWQENQRRRLGLPQGCDPFVGFEEPDQ